MLTSKTELKDSCDAMGCGPAEEIDGILKSSLNTFDCGIFGVRFFLS